MRFIRWLAAPVGAAALLFASLDPAAAKLLIEINKATQTMTVSQDGSRLYSWPVSTGMRAYVTPSGSYTPFRMEKDHFSKEWDDAPMPHSIFFTKQGHAIHGTEHLRNIGRPASHGCVRLQPGNAGVLFELVKRVGMANTRVVLEGDTPAAMPAVARAPRLEDRPRVRSTRIVTPQEQPDDDQPGTPPRYGEQPAYPRAAADDALYNTRRSYGVYQDEMRPGYWVQYPDGRRVFVDRERDPRLLPPRPFFGGPGWN